MSWPIFWENKTWQARAVSRVVAPIMRPLSWLVCGIAAKRLRQFEVAPPALPAGVDIIVVGNLVVGGSGKTPFIQWLVTRLQEKNVRVGIVSRGYGGNSEHWPRLVNAGSPAKEVGDEPVMLAASLNCPVAVSPKRMDAVNLLLANYTLDVIVSDDGLQHYSLARTLDIVMMDAQRLLGNKRCLPAGPLRESVSRLDKVDFVVINGGENPNEINMTLAPVCYRQVANPNNQQPLNTFANKTVVAIAGIGNPNRFFDQINQLCFKVKSTAFKDHHAYTLLELSALNTPSCKPLIMTEKDAVKCSAFAPLHWWYLEILPHCPDTLFNQISAKLNARTPPLT